MIDIADHMASYHKIIRLATMEDLPKIMAIKNEAVELMASLGNDQWDSTYPAEKTYISYIKHQYMYVMEESGSLVGMIGLVDHQDDEYKDVPWTIEGKEMVIHRLAISKVAYGKGYARELMEYAIEQARWQKVDIIKLDTYSKNNIAQKLFIRLGFTYVGDIHFPHRQAAYHCYEMLL